MTNGYNAPDPVEKSAERIAEKLPTLRDQFAMAALTGLTNYSGGGYYVDEQAKVLYPKVAIHAELAYAFAKAMLAERKGS